MFYRNANQVIFKKKNGVVNIILTVEILRTLKNEPLI